LRLVGVGNLRIGGQIARPILDADGQTLVPSGQFVDTATKRLIQDMRISRLYVVDAEMADVEVDPILGPEAYTDLLQQTYQALSQELRATTLRDAARLLVREVKQNGAGLLTAVDVRPLNAYIVGHSVWGAMLAVLVGRSLKYGDAQLLNLAQGMLVRDVGTRDLREELLTAEHTFSDEEYRETQEHARHGFDMLKDALQSSPLARSIALFHHERLDGSGYPRGARGDDIPQFGRIGAICDVYDALTSDRPHRAAMAPDQAISHILAHSDQFDAELARALAHRIAIYPPGITVMLDTGDLAVVVAVPHANPLRPIVRLTGTWKGVRYQHLRDIDLARHTDIRILSSTLEPAA